MRSTSTIEVSSTTRRPQSSGFSRSRLNPPVRGSTSSRRWTVFASKPVASLIRFAARPVGAHSSMSTPLAHRMRRIALTSVVLPTPGPPVITETFEASAVRTASAWPGARASPVLRSTQGSALSGSIRGHEGSPAAMSSMRPAIERSARCRPPRKMQGVSSTVSATTAPSASSRSSAVRISPAGTSSSFAASGPSSSSGRAQWPSSIASASAWPMPARTRTIAVFSMPSFMAIASAVTKPMPRMSRASR